jgi:hypothetical protein
MTKKRELASISALLLLAAPALAADYETEFAELTHGLPVEIRDFIDRRANCNHWLGEEPYDDERKEEIAAALMVLRCNYLRKDEHMLRRRYMRNEKALKALEISKDWSPG